MFSKRLLLLIAALALAGCSLRINEEVEKPEVKVNPLQSGCLTKAGDVLGRFFDGAIEHKELDDFWVCLEKAIHTFSTATKGSGESEFLGTELSGFLSKYFLKGKVIGPGFLHEAMLLKQAVLGGSADRLTKAELQRTLELIAVFRKVTLRVRPLMPIQARSMIARGYSSERFEEVLLEFQEGMAEIGKELEKSQGTYSFDSFAKLLQEMKAFLYPTREEPTWIDTAVQLTKALRPAKSLFISPPKDAIRDTDWSRIYTLGPRYYALFLRAGFALRSESVFTHGKGLASVESLFQETLSLLDLAIQSQPDKALHSREIEELVSALDSSRLLPVNTEVARKILRLVFVRLFTGSAPNEPYSVTSQTLDRLRDTFVFSSEGLKVLESIYRKELGKDFERGSLDPDKILSYRQEMMSLTGLRNSLSLEAVEAVKQSAARVRTIFPNRSTTVFIPEGGSPKLSLFHMTTLHLLHSANRLLFRAYGVQGTNPATEEQISRAADEIFPVLQSLNLMKEGTRQTLPKRLFEASLFLYSSDGHTSLSMTEALEFQALLLSTLTRGAKLHREITTLCSAKEADESGKALVPAPCYRAAFLERHQSIWAYIPGLANFFGSHKKSDQERLFLTMEKFLREGRGEESFTQTDSYSFILLPYYVELLFSRFDENRDGRLNNAESAKAYPVFRPFLAAKATPHGLTSDADHEALFSFLLAYRNLPNDMKLTWLWRRYITGDKKFNVDRGQVMEIFSKLLSL